MTRLKYTCCEEDGRAGKYAFLYIRNVLNLRMEFRYA